ncbi:AfsR/SARP family transcriptional regulator [Goodfellowiella coeruleoviolacea]|uniref:AfsR/SARP family transcriptional regulator n=1 Tax=Goodfellowiella coeruleoviolacea TaxID=334858 RepID=UPI0020A2C9C9|nr:BTAD domain-containing putative transcriptional regulator [Goodfellowiella coeruleoviolacea]
MRFEILGMLRAVRGSDEHTAAAVELGTPKQRAVLAVLLLARNTPVSRARIIDAVWAEAAPPSAVNLVQTYIAGLRRALEPGRARRAPGRLLTSTADGYLLRVDAGALDLEVFEQRTARATRLRDAGELAEAAATLAEALRMWRADPLGGVPGLFAEVERGRLVERRLAVLEEYAELSLALGRGARLVGELSRLLAEHPLRERLHGLLMRALHQAGRPAEALAAYRTARAVLVAELGVEPGPELRRLHQVILAGGAPEPAPAGGAVTAGGAGTDLGPAPTPAQLPRDPTTFLGRDGELAELDALLAEAHGTGPVVVVTGPAGVGKTALAVHWAHRVREHFPDGQLHADLHGYHPNREPLDAGEVLGRFLRALGVPPEEVPAATEERSALYRTVSADRRMLVLLDNARGSEELLPLLPGARSCVLVTSRRRLVGLVAHADARLVDLDMLAPEAAVAVLSRIAGGERARAEPGELDRLARLCDRLPLALRIAAARLAAAPTLRVAELVAELGSEHGRLGALGLEDGQSTVRAALDASHRALPAPAARVLALLGLHPGPEVTAWLVAATAEVPLPEAQRALDALVAAHLLAVGEPGRYTAHDLVRAYTRELAGQLPPEAAHTATERMLDYYLHCADLADGLLPIARGAVRVDPRWPPAHTPPLRTGSQAMAWLDVERANLVAAAEHAEANGWLTHAWQLPYTLSRFFWLRTDRNTWLRTHQLALRAARELGDPDAQFVTLFNLGVVLLQFRRFDEALAVQREALAVSRAQGDVDRQARALTTIANTLQDLGRHADSEEHYREAVRISHTAGARWAEANASHNLGLLQLATHRPEAAETTLRAALRMYHEVAERCGEASCLTDLAGVLLDRGRLADALVVARQALGVARQAASAYHQALAHDRVAAVLDRQGAAGATAHWQRALALFCDLDAPEAGVVRAHLARAKAGR